jgi:hypothetical protein
MEKNSTMIGRAHFSACGTGSLIAEGGTTPQIAPTIPTPYRARTNHGCASHTRKSNLGIDRSPSIALEALPTPIPKRWAVEANLPDDLEPGKYRLYLLASCQRCGVDTSASGTLTIV